MIKYFDYYNLDYDQLISNAKKHNFVNQFVKDEYFLGLERAKKKQYDLDIKDSVEPNPYEIGSMEWITQEIKNCKKNILHFCRYIKILDPADSFIKFNPYLYQQYYYHVLKDHKYIISDKCRQVGFSVGTYVYLLHNLLFKKDQRIDIISMNDDVSKDFLKKLKGTYENLPDWFKAINLFQINPDGGNNVHEITFMTGSRAKSLPRRKEGARSGSLSILVFDEAAFIEYMDKQWRGSYYAISRSEKSKAIVISTRNGNAGVGEWYYDKLTQTQNGETNFGLVEVNWWEVPEYLINPAWIDEAFRNTDRDSFLQEVCKKWLVAGDTVLDKEKLLAHPVEESISNKVVDMDTSRSEAVDGLHVFKKPEEEKAYGITADCGTGAARSFSSCHVFDMENNEQVAEFKKRINTNEYAKVLVKLSKYYNGAIIAVERNNPGEAVISDLYHAHNYKDRLYKRSRKRPQYRDYGWVTSNKTRPLLINALIDDYENDNVIIRGKRTIDEGLSFIWDEKSQKPVGAPGANDDLIIAWAMYCHLKDSLYQEKRDASGFSNGMEESANLWGIIGEDQYEQDMVDNYWLYGSKTREKIRKNLSHRFNEKEEIVSK